MDIAERVGGRLIYRAEALVRATCEHRRVPEDVVVAIVTGWAERSDRASKMAALDLLDLLPTPVAHHRLGRALQDGRADVRASAASKVADLYDRNAGLALIERYLAVEPHNLVRAELLRAEADLVVRS